MLSWNLPWAVTIPQKKEPFTMLIPLAIVGPDQLRAADVIEAVDPTQPSYRQQIWGQGVIPPMQPYPSGPHTVQVVEVQIDCHQHAQFQTLLHQVKAAKGCLHSDVEALVK
jgi:hypothetical protein